MNWEAFGAIGEVVGAIGVILTLGFLALQIRQNTKSLVAETEMQMNFKVADIYSRIGSNPELLRSWMKAIEDATPLSLEEEAKFGWQFSSVIWTMQGCFAQFKRGNISEEMMLSVLQNIFGIMEASIAKDLWDDEVWSLNSDFHDYVNKMREQTTWSPGHLRGGYKPRFSDE